MLAVCAALLVFDGAARGPVSVQVSGDSGRFDAERIASILQRVNPALSETQSHRIGSAVERSSARYGLDPELVTAVLLVESTARPWARSGKGAVGLMQVMPYMVEPLGLAGNLTTIESNIEAGCLILSDNIRRLGEDDGISAYFWGSDIRGVAYLDRVRQARATVRRFSES
jgi:soluble lytic murein transglycosylase-like protein